MRWRTPKSAPTEHELRRRVIESEQPTIVRRRKRATENPPKIKPMPTADELEQFRSATEWIKDHEAEASVQRHAPEAVETPKGKAWWGWLNERPRLILNERPLADCPGKIRCEVVNFLKPRKEYA